MVRYGAERLLPRRLYTRALAVRQQRQGVGERSRFKIETPARGGPS